MAEAVGLVASIVQIAGTGAKLSSALYHFTTSAVRADQDIADIASDIDLTSNALESIGKVFETEDTQSIISKKAILDANSIIKRCEAVFRDIADLVEKRRVVSKHGKKSLSVMGKLSWPMKEQRVELYRRRLESLKNSLTLLLHVLQLAQGQSRGQLEREAVEHEREKIRELHQRQQDSLRSLQALESKLGQVSIDDRPDSGSAQLRSQASTPLPMSGYPVHIHGVLGGPDNQIQSDRNIFPSGSDIDTSDSEVSGTEEEGEPLSLNELAKAEQHVLRLLKRVKELQMSSHLVNNGKSHHRRRMHRVYQRFCRNWELSISCGHGDPRWTTGHDEPTSQSTVHDLRHSEIPTTMKGPACSPGDMLITKLPLATNHICEKAPTNSPRKLMPVPIGLYETSDAYIPPPSPLPLPSRRYVRTRPSTSQEHAASYTGEQYQTYYVPGKALVCDYPDCGKTFYRLDLFLRHRERHNDPTSALEATQEPLSVPACLPMDPISSQEEAHAIPKYTINPFRTPQFPNTTYCPSSGYANPSDFGVSMGTSHCSPCVTSDTALQSVRYLITGPVPKSPASSRRTAFQESHDRDQRDLASTHNETRFTNDAHPHGQCNTSTLDDREPREIELENSWRDMNHMVNSSSEEIWNIYQPGRGSYNPQLSDKVRDQGDYNAERRDTCQGRDGNTSRNGNNGRDSHNRRNSNKDGVSTNSPVPIPMNDEFSPSSYRPRASLPPSRMATLSPIPGLRPGIQVTRGRDVSVSSNSSIDYNAAIQCPGQAHDDSNVNSAARTYAMNDTTKIEPAGEKRVGRRRGPLRPEQRQQAHEMRKLHIRNSHSMSSCISTENQDRDFNWQENQKPLSPSRRSHDAHAPGHPQNYGGAWGRGRGAMANMDRPEPTEDELPLPLIETGRPRRSAAPTFGDMTTGFDMSPSPAAGPVGHQEQYMIPGRRKNGKRCLEEEDTVTNGRLSIEEADLHPKRPRSKSTSETMWNEPCFKKRRPMSLYPLVDEHDGKDIVDILLDEWTVQVV